MKKIIQLCLCLFTALPLFTKAQLSFPKIPFVKLEKGYSIDTYIPTGDFLNRFPSFTEDGKYYFDEVELAKHIRIHPYKMYPDYYFPSDDNVLSGHYYGDGKMMRGESYQFDSREFPADMTTSAKKFIDSKITNLLIKFGNQVPFTSKKWSDYKYRYSLKFEIDNAPKFNLIKDDVAFYHSLNDQYKSTLQAIIVNKGFNTGQYIDHSAAGYPDNLFNRANVILDFECMDLFFMSQVKSDGYFPAYALYNLLVKNAQGDLIAKYGQCLFFKINGQKYKDEPSIIPEYYILPSVFKILYPIAFESLINRFLNDDATISVAVAQNDISSKKSAVDPSFAKAIELKYRYASLKERKAELIALAQNANGKLEGVIISQQNRQEENNAAVNQAAARTGGNTTAMTLTGLLENMMSSGQSKKDVKLADQRMEAINAAYQKLRLQEQAFITDVSALDSYQDISAIIAEIKADDETLANSLQQASENKANAAKAISGSAGVSAVHLSQLNTALQSSQFHNGTVQSSAVTASSSPAKHSADECSTQATAAWKSSAEYRTYLGTKLNADMKDSEAKLIELTLQYCSSKLSPQEIATDKKAASQARQDARDLRKATPNVKL